MNPHWEWYPEGARSWRYRQETALQVCAFGVGISVTKRVPWLAIASRKQSFASFRRRTSTGSFLVSWAGSSYLRFQVLDIPRESINSRTGSGLYSALVKRARPSPAISNGRGRAGSFARRLKCFRFLLECGETSESRRKTRG
jgi:hypothetical protein